jgi:manganese/iron transport system substrate-binding protein
MVHTLSIAIKPILAVLILLLVLIGRPAFAPASEDLPIIVASTTQIADFTRQIGGDQVVVRSILAPGADPHTYLPTPDDVQIVLSADLCLENGLHLEGKSWMATLARDGGKPLVTATDGIQPLLLESSGDKISDPHAWLVPRNAAVYVNNIADALIRLTPDARCLDPAAGQPRSAAPADTRHHP